MKAIVLYRPISEHATMVESYLRDFKMQTGKELTTIDVDSPQGIAMCRLYEIMQYPAIVATDDDGRLLNMWVGEQLPRIGEVGYYAAGEPGRL